MERPAQPGQVDGLVPHARGQAGAVLRIGAPHAVVLERKLKDYQDINKDKKSSNNEFIEI